jgi:hypothetical protein
MPERVERSHPVGTSVSALEKGHWTLGSPRYSAESPHFAMDARASVDKVVKDHVVPIAINAAAPGQATRYLHRRL